MNAVNDNLKKTPQEKLSSQELALIYNAYDIIGDIAIIRVPEQLASRSGIIAAAVMTQHKHVKAVWRQSSPVSGDFRLRELEWIAGEKRAETLHKEYGGLFKVDVSECYFSPRLAFERMRIANMVGDNEVVVNMFAGVGVYSILIAKRQKSVKVVSIDLNPVAVRYMHENILLNKVVNQVIPIKGDARAIVQERLSDTANRVLMPLPETAYNYLNSAISAIRAPRGWIHYYDFEHARKQENAIDKVATKIGERLHDLGTPFELASSRIVRQTGPNWYQVALDLQVDK
jgi:tRNA (guanine37-N1)-methyltransferase